MSRPCPSPSPENPFSPASLEIRKQVFDQIGRIVLTGSYKAGDSVRVRKNLLLHPSLVPHFIHERLPAVPRVPFLPQEYRPAIFLVAQATLHMATEHVASLAKITFRRLSFSGRPYFGISSWDVTYSLYNAGGYPESRKAQGLDYLVPDTVIANNPSAALENAVETIDRRRGQAQQSLLAHGPWPMHSGLVAIEGQQLLQSLFAMHAYAQSQSLGPLGTPMGPTTP